MARSINDLEKDLLALPREDRARSTLDLIRSLEKDEEPLSREEWEAAWVEETRRRLEDIQAGRVELLDAERVMAQLRARYPKK